MTCPLGRRACQELGTPQKGRSFQQHKRFFAVVAAAWKHWPESRKELLDDAEHLRAWLLVKAGWRHLVPITVHDAASAEQAAMVIQVIMRERSEHHWTDVRGNELVTAWPKSISYADMTHSEACEFFTRVEDVVCNVLRINDCDQLLEETERAA